jgi:hypothetical protein
MSDIVTRLRDQAPYGEDGPIMLDAANTILRLREQLAHREITTVEGILQLHVLDIVLYDDSENAGPIATYIVPDDGTVVFSTPETFHLMDGAGNYTYAWAMPLPLTLIRKAS